MKDAFTFRLQGTVTGAPVTLHRVSGAALDAVRFVVAVEQPAFAEGKQTRMQVEVEAWAAARPAAEALKEGDRVCILGNVVRRQMVNSQGGIASRKDGSSIWLTDFRAQAVLVEPVAKQQAPAGKPMPVMEEDKDIPF